MTIEELRHMLHEFDDDIEVQTFDPGTGAFEAPDFELVERSPSDWATKGRWLMRLWKPL